MLALYLQRCHLFLKGLYLVGLDLGERENELAFDRPVQADIRIRKDESSFIHAQAFFRICKQDINEDFLILEESLDIIGKLSTTELTDIEIAGFCLVGADDEFLGIENEIESESFDFLGLVLLSLHI